MSGLNYALRVLKSVFSPDNESLEAYLETKNPQDSCELNYWIEQYEHFGRVVQNNKHNTML